MTKKNKIYSIFQFMCLCAYVFWFLSWILMTVWSKTIIENDILLNNLDNGEVAFWGEYTRGILSFEFNNLLGSFISVLQYIAIALLVGSWIVGFNVLKIRNRNLSDQFFLLFMIIPFISNIITLFAIMSTSDIKLASKKFDKKQEFKDQLKNARDKKATQIESLTEELNILKLDQ